MFNSVNGVLMEGIGGVDVTPKLSGNSLPENVTSPHHVVHVNFFSDRFSAGNGWRLEWIEGKVTNYTKNVLTNKLSNNSS